MVGKKLIKLIKKGDSRMKYGIFNTLQKRIEKSEDINLMYQFQHDIINYEIQQRRERLKIQCII